METLKRLCLNLAARSRIFEPLLRMIIGWEHRREIRAVAAGQIAFRRTFKTVEDSSFELRRCIHRIEKGLTMRPRKPSFASEYISVTLDCLANAARHASYDQTEKQWAVDVLGRYFAEVDRSDTRIADAADRYAGILSEFGLSVSAEPLVPFRRDLSKKPVSPEALHELAVQRRSTRWFLDRPVDRMLIDKAFETAGQAPTACNRQPFRFLLFDDPADTAKLAGIALGTKGFSHQIPCLAVIVGRLSAYPFSRDRHAIYIDASLAAMSLMFALETRGLSSCPINWPDAEPYESRMAQAAGLERHERVVMLLAMGWPHPDVEVPRSAKKQLGILRTWQDRNNV